MEGDGEGPRRKHGSSMRCARHGLRASGGHDARHKIHIAVDEQTLEIGAVEATSIAIGDAPAFPGLLNQITPLDEMACGTAIAL